MDAATQERIARTLGVDECVVIDGLGLQTVKLRLGRYRGQVEIDPRLKPIEIGQLLMDLAISLRQAPYNVETAMGDDLDRLALNLGVVRNSVPSGGTALTPDGMRESFLATAEYRCARCGHPSKMHGRDRGLVCTIWGCDCKRFIDGPSEAEIAQARLLASEVMTVDEARAQFGLPPLAKEPPPPADRFAAIVEELFKEEP